MHVTQLGIGQVASLIHYLVESALVRRIFPAGQVTQFPGDPVHVSQLGSHTKHLPAANWAGAAHAVHTGLPSPPAEQAVQPGGH